VIQNQLEASRRLVANVMNDDFMTMKAFWGGITKIQDWAACFGSRRSLNSLYAYADPYNPFEHASCPFLWASKCLYKRFVHHL
jgi:hypothetical protein